MKRRPIPPDSERCKAEVTREGVDLGRCERRAHLNGYCFSHDPKRLAKQLDAQIKRRERELAELRRELDGVEKLLDSN